MYSEVIGVGAELTPHYHMLTKPHRIKYPDSDITTPGTKQVWCHWQTEFIFMIFKKCNHCLKCNCYIKVTGCLSLV